MSGAATCRSKARLTTCRTVECRPAGVLHEQFDSTVYLTHCCTYSGLRANMLMESSAPFGRAPQWRGFRVLPPTSHSGIRATYVELADHGTRAFGCRSFTSRRQRHSARYVGNLFKIKILFSHCSGRSEVSGSEISRRTVGSLIPISVGNYARPAPVDTATGRWYPLVSVYGTGSLGHALT